MRMNYIIYSKLVLNFAPFFIFVFDVLTMATTKKKQLLLIIFALLRAGASENLVPSLLCKSSTKALQKLSKYDVADENFQDHDHVTIVGF